MLITYLPAQYYNVKDPYVGYYVVDPSTNKMVRKRIKLKRIKSSSARRKFAKELVFRLNEKLANNWNPFVEQDSPKSFHKFFPALDTYLAIKTKELSKDTVRTYRSYINILKNYLEKKYDPDKMNILDFTKQTASGYMNHIYIARDVGEKAHNNHLIFCKSLFNWMIQNQYCKVNPFVSVKTKKERKKIRIPIDMNYRNKIKEYLIRKKEHEYLAMCMLTYYAFIRPKETCLLKSGMFDMEKQLIKLPPEITKNGKERNVTIPDNLVKYLDKLDIPNIDKKLYIFSTNFKPGKMLKDSRYVGKRWTKLRSELNLPKELQFYSLKDTGIIQMIRDGVSLETVRDQADHSSLEVTNKYAQLANLSASSQIKTKSSEF